MPADDGALPTNPGWQFTITLVVSIVVFGGGTVAAMILGRDIPAAMWAIDGGIANALVAHAGFFTQRAMHIQTLGAITRVTQNLAGGAGGGAATTTKTTSGEQGSGGGA